MKDKTAIGLSAACDNRIKESYKNIIHEKHGFLNFAAYSSVTGKNSKDRLKVPIQDIFLPFDFSRFDNHDKQVITSADMIENIDNKVILAGPGYGKTTFLKFVLLNISLEKMIPVYLQWKYVYPRLEDTRDLRAILLSHFKEYLKDEFKIKEIETFVQGHKFVFLLDGFDEVEQGGRLPFIQEMIKQHKKAYAGNYFIIASRIANYPREYLDFFSKNGFHHYKINPLSDHLIFQYINKFINCQLPGDTLKSTDKIKFLSNYVERQAGIKALAEHPLLLSLIVLIYTFEASLPDTRVNLYERCIDLLIYVWKKSNMDIEVFNELSLDNNTLYALLCEIAYKYFERFIQGKVKEFGLLPGEELRKILEKAYNDVTRQRLPDRDVDAVIEKLFNYFKNNTGIIAEISPGSFGFSHLTLLEYLAAKRIVKEKGNFTGNLDYIVELLENPEFRTVEEVVIFQVELLGKSTSKSRFIDLLAKRFLAIFKEEKNYTSLVLLAKLLRNNQEFSIHDTKEILKLITITAARNPEDVELYSLLNDIFLLSGKSRNYFVEMLSKSTREREIWENFSLRTAHRIGNEVFSIRSDLELLEREYRKLPKDIASKGIEQELTKIEEQIKSLNMILEEYRDFASEIDIAYREYTIDSLMRELVEKFRKVYPAISFEYSSNKSDLSAFTDKARIEQIIEELIENSIKYAKVETLKIDLSLECVEKRFIIHYRDNGKGISSKIKAKIFEPFFSTDSKSTGIGLANVKKIVESLDGEIRETGKENKGVHFELSFGR